MNITAKTTLALPLTVRQALERHKDLGYANMSEMASAAIRRLVGEDDAQALDVGTVQAMVRDLVDQQVAKKFDAEREFLLQDCVIRAAERVREALAIEEDADQFEEAEKELIEEEEEPAPDAKSWKV